MDIAGSRTATKCPWLRLRWAAADTDLDGLDELLGVSENGKLAVCDVDDWDCEQFNLNGNATMIDLAAADVDGDALAEVVLLLDIAKTRYIYVYNVDNELTGQEESWYIDVSSDVIRISAGDLDDDRMAEIVALKDGGGLGSVGRPPGNLPHHSGSRTPARPSATRRIIMATDSTWSSPIKTVTESPRSTCSTPKHASSPTPRAERLF